jgi:CheY-like chemotaxis protein
MAYLLIVDDDEDFAVAAACLLRAAGHEVATELDPRSAVRSVEKRLPDVAILDVMFPEDPAAGFELARVIRHLNEKARRIPILLLTAVNAAAPLGFGTEDAGNEELPVDGILEKPVDFEVLGHKISELLRKRRECIA